MHMLEAAREGRKPHKDFEIFEDRVQSDGGFVGYSDYDDRRNSGERVRMSQLFSSTVSFIYLVM